MKLLLFTLLVIAAALAVGWVIRHGKIERVAHARLLVKTWSVWLASLGSFIGAWAQSFPDSAINAWSSLPGDVKTVIPQHYLGLIGSFLVAMAVIAQFVRQKSLTNQKEDKS